MRRVPSVKQSVGSNNKLSKDALPSGDSPLETLPTGDTSYWRHFLLETLPTGDTSFWRLPTGDTSSFSSSLFTLSSAEFRL
ncbi:hypothetical protein BgiBS90_027657 [Biomphalaria glabrata]|nr:hypothetical protein BgiBS90_027657 [Biomphalaria glabrata]